MRTFLQGFVSRIDILFIGGDFGNVQHEDNEEEEEEEEEEEVNRVDVGVFLDVCWKRPMDGECREQLRG